MHFLVIWLNPDQMHHQLGKINDQLPAFDCWLESLSLYFFTAARRVADPRRASTSLEVGAEVETCRAERRSATFLARVQVHARGDRGDSLHFAIEDCLSMTDRIS